MEFKRIAVFAAIVVALAAGAWGVLHLMSPEDHAHTPPSNAAESGGERRVLYWYDPMRPEVHFDKPGKSPFMDMQLVPKYADDSGESAIEIDPRTVQNLGMRTAPVVSGALGGGIEVVGLVEVDERNIHAIEARAPGWVERLDVRAVGDVVRRGQRVAGIYSPELLAAQSELLIARSSGEAALTDAARERLGLLGMPRSQIAEVLESARPQRQVSITAPSNGIVTELNVREGQQVGGSEPLMRIADLSKVWVTVAVPEAQAHSVRVGGRGEVRLRALPGRVFEGRLDYVYPRLESDTRTVRARIVLDNADLALKPGMYADVVLLGEEERSALLVPIEAVIRTGTRSVVIVAEDAGRFRPAHVTLGAERGDRIEILSGLEAGERVVVSGQFLIDSEASLRGAFNRIATPHEHHPDGEHP